LPLALAALGCGRKRSLHDLGLGLGRMCPADLNWLPPQCVAQLDIAVQHALESSMPRLMSTHRFQLDVTVCVLDMDCACRDRGL